MSVISSSEDLICIKDLGIQLSSVYFTGRELKEFIPKKLIADVVVNEVFYIVSYDNLMIFLCIASHPILFCISWYSKLSVCPKLARQPV